MDKKPDDYLTPAKPQVLQSISKTPGTLFSIKDNSNTGLGSVVEG